MPAGSGIIGTLVAGCVAAAAGVTARETSAAGNRPPNRPSLQAPADGTANTPLQLYLRWGASDPG